MRNKVKIAWATDAAQALKIRRQAVDLPVAVARRFGAVAAADFLRAIGRRAVIGGVARRGLVERAFGGRAKRSFLGRGLFPDILGGKFRRFRIWRRHDLHLAQPPPGCKCLAQGRRSVPRRPR